jgi:AraC-like DNA-binding protein
MRRFLPRFRVLCATLASVACLAASAPARAGETEPSARGDDRATRALAEVGEGALALRSGRLLAACDAFGRAVKLTPTWAMARLEYARCLRLVGDPRGEAPAHLEVALAALADRAAPFVERAHQEEDAGRMLEAFGAYRQAEILARNDPEAEAGLVRCSATTAGITTLERVRRASRGSPALLAAWWRVAEVAEAVGFLDEAELALRYLVDHGASPKRAAAALAAFSQRTSRPAAMQRARQVIGF